MFSLVSLKKTSNLRNKRIVGISISKKRRNRNQNLRSCESRRPSLLENIKANTTTLVNVTVINLSLKSYLGSLEGIILRKLDGEEEKTTLVRRTLRTENGCLPLKKIITINTGSAVIRWLQEKQRGKNKKKRNDKKNETKFRENPKL